MTESLPPAAASHGHEEASATRTRFIDAEQRDMVCRALAEGQALVVRIEDVGAQARGRLADVIDEAIERELDARGGAPPGIGASSDADAALGDQLFRARRVGAKGIALVLGPLGAAASPRGAIEPEDAATLRFWADADADRPVWLLLDESDTARGAYADPAPLHTVLERTGPGAASRSDATAQRPEPETPTPAAALAEPEEVVAQPAPPAATAMPSVHPLARHTSGASVVNPGDDGEWRSWVLALSAARGPQSLASFERLFARDYVPLMNAIAGGLDDPRALQADDEFRRTFSRAYAEACPAFGVTGKRPKMVLDAPEVAAKIARLHGARTTQLLLVDAMRFDIGGLVRDGVRGGLGARASLTDELVLWSALPTTTTRQLETLQRGPEALRSSPHEADRESDSLRGRTAEVIRRVKVGSRDLYKLDVVEARLRDTGPDALSSFPSIAGAAADAVVRHAQTLQPRTLLFVFGDHGFTFDREGKACQGGASPEEVLVPAFAFLVADVH
jgi:hypothetical protein